MNLNTDPMDDGYNSYSVLNDVSPNTDLIGDLMVFPDDVIVAWDDYDPITYAHLGTYCHVITPEDDEAYLVMLTLYNKQKEHHNE